ncbi:MAG: FAD-dependent oxidoreductase [Flavobacteriales bacterium]|nr:FAD-dependent oxidoreductase [Flavobacteriales bacterium]
MNRRQAIRLVTVSGAGLFLLRCSGTNARTFPVKLNGASAERGHRLREAGTGKPSRIEHEGVIIVGGGVAGLSAAGALKEGGVDDLLVLELEDEVGGNARSGANAHGRFPLGAHYLPVPETSDDRLIAFLGSCGSIIGRTQEGLPVYNEEHLCGDPHERLFHRGQWRSGIRPRSGLSAADEAQFDRFERMVEDLRQVKGEDGRWAFAIPVDASSTSEDTEALRRLDDISFSDWLAQLGFSAPALLWYLDYSCMDDLGAPAQQVSAWAGLHYFAARRGYGANAEQGSVLTWPEGNDFLVNALKRPVKDHTRTAALVRSVRSSGETVEVDVEHMDTGEMVRYTARHVVLSVPQFIASRILGPVGERRAAGLEYAPWVVVNLTLERPPEERGGEPMAWDNVLFGSKSLGYVNASHQRLDHPRSVILTHYRALTGRTPRLARELVAGVEIAQWVDDAVAELEQVHPDIRDRILEAEVAIWGHGMIVPIPGFIHGGVRRELQRPIGGRIHFAHSDLSGMSLFEEAFHHGSRVAQEILSGWPA